MSTFHSNNVALHRRTHSFKSTLARGPSSPKSSSLGKKRITEVETTPSTDEIDADDSDMTFLQYCPTCEKQIVVPNSSILYCSESCRRKDSTYCYTMPSMSSSTSLSSTYTYSTSPSSADECEDLSPSKSTTRIIPLRSPSTLSTFGSKPSTLHAFKADLDPTEWKPAEPESNTLGTKSMSKSTPMVAVSLGTAIKSSAVPPMLDVDSDAGPRPILHHHRANSAASNYLSQFHHPSRTGMLPTRPSRPGLAFRTSTSALPLSRTAPPAHATSAVSTGNSLISNSSESIVFLRTPEEGSDGPRHGQILNHSSGRRAGSKGVKSWEPLVKPIFYDGMAAKDSAWRERDVGVGEIDYKKKRLSGLVPRMGQGALSCGEEIQEPVPGSLSKLLGKEKDVEPLGA